MNILPILLGILAWQMFNGKNKTASQKEEIPKSGLGEEMSKGGILNDLLNNPDALSSLTHISKLFDKNAPQEEKSAAVFALLSNPAVFEFAKHFFASQNKSNDDDFDNGPYTPSDEVREAFRPIAPIAGVEITEKLCYLYDNWYIKR